MAGTRDPAAGTRLGDGRATVPGPRRRRWRVFVVHPQQPDIRVTATRPLGPPVAHGQLAVGGRTVGSLDVLTGTHRLTIGPADFGPGRAAAHRHHTRGQPGAAARASNPDGPAIGRPPGPSDRPTSPAAPPPSMPRSRRSTWTGAPARPTWTSSGGQLSGISFNAAASSLVTLALPRPHGNVPVQMVGGASDFQLSLPKGPAQVTAGGGAGEVSVEGQQHTGVAGGSRSRRPVGRPA